MTYRVELADSARADADAIYSYIAAEGSSAGSRWFERLPRALRPLDHMPLRCPLAREAGRVRRPIRCLSFGRRNRAYRILYEIDEQTATVWILHIRHGARQDLEPEDLRIK